MGKFTIALLSFYGNMVLHKNNFCYDNIIKLLPIKTIQDYPDQIKTTKNQKNEN